MRRHVRWRAGMAAVGMVAVAGGAASAGAQAAGAPFVFTVPAPVPGLAGVTMQYAAGYGERTFEPLAADRVEQDLAVAATTLGGRLLLVGTTGLAVNGPVGERGARTAGQAEALLNVLPSGVSAVLGGLQLAAGAGVRREYTGTTDLLSRASVGRTAAAWEAYGNVLVDRAVAGLTRRRYAADVAMSVGWAHALAGGFEVGAEAVGQDVEGFWQSTETEGGATVYLGPALSWQPAHAGRTGTQWRFVVSGGPVLRASGNGVATGLPSSASDVLPAAARRNGFLLRTALSLGL